MENEAWKQGFAINNEEPEKILSEQEGIFDIKKELANILKLPTSERRAALTAYKEKLNEFHQGMATFQADLIKKIRENPDIDLEDLNESLKEAGLKLGFNETSGGDETFNLAERTLKEYVSKHAAVREARKNFPNDSKLYKYLFDKEPVGKVKVIEGPMMLYVCCENIEDFEYAAEKTDSKEEMDSKDSTDSYKDTEGMFLGDSIHENLGGCICIENSSSRGIENAPDKNTYDHEEQHAFYDMIWRNFYDNFSTEGEIASAKTIEEKRLAIQRKLRDIRETEADDSARDEILAFMKEHYENPKSLRTEIKEAFKNYLTEYNKISKIIALIKYFQAPKVNRYAGGVYGSLTTSKQEGGVYDYLGDKIESQVTEIESLMSPEDSTLIKEMVEKIFVTEYKQLLISSLQSFIKIKQKGYSIDETIAILQTYSLRDWNKLPARISSKATNIKYSVE